MAHSKAILAWEGVAIALQVMCCFHPTRLASHGVGVDKSFSETLITRFTGVSQ